ncbi:unnamed protein product [Orchesella dallaii]|uniref:SCP domain-containing protein n=1 Tax=Orchesella dallaii TaxID=48710 RepID=A0ABP1R5X3_9HEXA
MAQKAAQAMCWVEKAIPPPPVDLGQGNKLLCFDDCYAYQMDFLKNEYDDFEGDVKEIAESIKEKMTKYFPEYSKCIQFLDEPEKSPDVDYSTLLEDADGGEYPFRGFAHCLLEMVEKLKGNETLEKVKERWQSPKSVEQTMLDRQNEFRAYRGVPPFTLDPELTKRASNWAEHMSDQHRWHSDIHSRYMSVVKPDDPDLILDGSPIGETVSLEVAVGMSPQDRAISVVDLWYNEWGFYRWPYYNGKNVKFEKIRCFTQTVWKSSTKVGYGVSYRNATDDFVIVAFYHPAGNIVTEDFAEFKENVLPVIH